MKNYTVRVNGNTYEVSVEENTGVPSPTPVAAAQPVPQAVAPAPAPAKTPPAAKTAAPASSGVQGDIKITSPMPGKIISVKTSPNQAIKKGEVILILEAMKMENEIVAPEDGNVASINVTDGQSVESGDVLATLN